MTPREVFERAHGFVRSCDLRCVDCFAPRYEAMRQSRRVIREYENLCIQETRDPEVIVAEFDAVIASRDGTIERRSFIHVLRVRGDEIVAQRDDFDSHAMADRLRVT